MRGMPIPCTNMCPCRSDAGSVRSERITYVEPLVADQDLMSLHGQGALRRLLLFRGVQLRVDGQHGVSSARLLVCCSEAAVQVTNDAMFYLVKNIVLTFHVLVSDRSSSAPACMVHHPAACEGDAATGSGTASASLVPRYIRLMIGTV